MMYQGSRTQLAREATIPGGRSVISLLIRDKDKPEMVLIGVRDPNTNSRHPNVVSTITGRIPNHYLHEFLRTARLKKIGKDSLPEQVESAYIATSYEVVSTKSASDEFYPLFFYVNSLLKQKVLDCIRPKFDAHIISVVRGNVIYDQSEVVPEDRWLFKETKVGGTMVYSEMLNMIGIEVMIENARCVPVSNESYSKFSWVTETQFMEMVGKKSVEPVVAALGTKAVMYCVKGLCLTSAYAKIKERQHDSTK
jgi:hypothetical protein